MKTILIADDNYDFREMLRQFLGASGYRTLEATDGEQAVEVAARESPDLILMDLGLPGTDGLSAVTAIREHLLLAGLPILIVSAYDRLEYRTEAISAGCSGYITKPVDLDELLKTLDILLQQEGGGGGESRLI